MIIGEVLKQGWDTTKKYFGFFAGVIIAYLAIIVVGALVLKNLSWIGQIILILLQVWLEIGLIIIALKKAKGEDASFGDLFAGGKYILSYLGASILYGLIVLAGTILLIFPGVIWGLKYMFFPYLIVDKNMKAMEALKESAKITSGIKWDLLGISIVISIVSILGVFCLIIGLLWTIPTALLAYAAVYLKVSK